GAIKGFSHLQALGVLTSNQWYHVAVVARANATKLYVNGALVVTNEFSNDWKPPREPDRANYLVRSVFASQRQLGADPDLDGEMSEVRIWAGERTAEGIQTNLAKPLTGNEQGLIALWNFDDPANPGRDASPNGHQAELKGNARVLEEQPVMANANPVTSTATSSSNRVLDLAGTNGYVELPAQLFTNTLVTVEGWVKWRSFGSYSRWFQFADAGLMLAVMNLNQSDALRIERFDSAQFDGLRVANLTNVLRAGEWQHI